MEIFNTNSFIFNSDIQCSQLLWTFLQDQRTMLPMLRTSLSFFTERSGFYRLQLSPDSSGFYVSFKMKFLLFARKCLVNSINSISTSGYAGSSDFYFPVARDIKIANTKNFETGAYCKIKVLCILSEVILRILKKLLSGTTTICDCDNIAYMLPYFLIEMLELVADSSVSTLSIRWIWIEFAKVRLSNLYNIYYFFLIV
jgi:hypothetical protein